MTDMTLAGPGPVRFGATEATESRQGEPPFLDTGLACLVMMARLHGVATDADQLAHEFGGSSSFQGLQIEDILLAAKKLALLAKRVKVDVARLDKTPLPAIAIGRDEQGRAEFFILARVESDKALIQSPKAGRPEAISIADLQARWPGGELILFTSRASLAGEMARFDFTWFIPAVVKYRKLLLEVLAVSFVLQLFALITPLFFQVVMDKVLVHRGYTTLDVIAIGFAVVVVFEVTLTALRSYVFAHTTSRIDVELGARLFRHLLGLPLAYFQARRVGDSVARVRELENVRSFLTGNALTVVLDLLFSVVFIAVMAYYDTLVGEHGSTLSGGQRQRIAIARALISNPRILILDEATSALDYESERIIQNNMKAIAKGRTVIIVAHRLSAVRDANRIVVMERGQIVETGPHAQLLQIPDGAYAALHKLQQG